MKSHLSLASLPATLVFFLGGCTSENPNPFGSSSRLGNFDTEETAGIDTADTNTVDTSTEETATETDTSETVTVEKPEPDIVFLMDDDTERDGAPAPQIDIRRNDGGITLTQKWSDANWTRPATVSMSTGKTGFGVGENVYGDDSQPQIPEDMPTIGRIFAENGWATRMDGCNPVAVGAEGDDGFDSVEVCEHPETDGITMYDQFVRTVEWMHEHEGERMLISFKFMSHHGPWVDLHPSCADDAQADVKTACPGWYGDLEGYSWPSDLVQSADCQAAAKAIYDCAALQADEYQEAGLQLLEDEGFLENAVIFKTADHGENIHENHGGGTNGDPMVPVDIGHHRGMAAQVSKNPGWIWWPGAPKMEVNFPVGHIDILPTLLDVANINGYSEDMEGVSVFTLMEDPDLANNRILSQFACDDGGSWNGAVYVDGGVVMHTIAQYSRNNGSEIWATYEPEYDPEEADPYMGEDEVTNNDVVDLINNQISGSKTWPCK